MWGRSSRELRCLTLWAQQVRHAFFFSMHPKGSAEPSSAQVSFLSGRLHYLHAAGGGSREISGESNALRVRSAHELAGGDFMLSDLHGCTVHLRGRMGALHIRGLKDCLVYAGPVMGATFVDGIVILSPFCSCPFNLCPHESRGWWHTDVQGSCLVLVSHQVRIHTTADTLVCLRVQSNPILEDCTNIRCWFASLLHASLECNTYLFRSNKGFQIWGRAGSQASQLATLTQASWPVWMAYGRRMASGPMCRTSAG